MKTVDEEIPGFGNFIHALADHMTLEEVKIIERGNKYFDHLNKLRENNHTVETCDYCVFKR